MRDFKQLKVWAKSHELALEVYRVSRLFPREEMYGITSQIRRAASSIPANIAEGCGRNGVPELARFLSIAMGSASELEYHIMLAHDLDLLSSEAYVQLSSKADEVKRMLGSYIEKMDADLRNHKSSTKNPKLESKEQGQQTTVSITS